jgi:hypothetical protein
VSANSCMHQGIRGRSKHEGGIEYGQRHYPLIVVLHDSWLIAVAIGIRRDPAVRTFPPPIIRAVAGVAGVGPCGAGQPLDDASRHGSWRAARAAWSLPFPQPSYLYGHSALSGASSRHSGGKGVYGRTTRSRAGTGMSRGPGSPGIASRRTGRRVHVVETGVNTPWSRCRVD